MEVVVIGLGLIAFFLFMCLTDNSGENRYNRHGQGGGYGGGMQQPHHPQQPPIQQNPYPQNPPPHGQHYRQGQGTNLSLLVLLVGVMIILIATVSA